MPTQQMDGLTSLRMSKEIIAKLRAVFLAVPSMMAPQPSADLVRAGVDEVRCSPAFDAMDGRAKFRVMMWLAGFEEAWYACKGWRDNDRQFRE